jgi:hypothetical protein
VGTNPSFHSRQLAEEGRGVTLLRKIALAVIVVDSLIVGVWAQFLPRSFYDHFPGFGRMWVAMDGPFNEHLIRDVGGLNLALGLVAVWALVANSLIVARVAGAASLVYGVPHLVYHSAHAHSMDTVDAVGTVGALAFAVVVGLAALVLPATSATADR